MFRALLCPHRNNQKCIATQTDTKVNRTVDTQTTTPTSSIGTPAQASTFTVITFTKNANGQSYTFKNVDRIICDRFTSNLRVTKKNAHSCSYGHKEEATHICEVYHNGTVMATRKSMKELKKVLYRHGIVAVNITYTL